MEPVTTIKTAKESWYVVHAMLIFSAKRILMRQKCALTGEL